MKKDQLKSLIREIIEEITNPPQKIKENQWEADFEKEETERFNKWKSTMGQVSYREEHSYRYGFRDGYNAASEGY